MSECVCEDVYVCVTMFVLTFAGFYFDVDDRIMREYCNGAFAHIHVLLRRYPCMHACAHVKIKWDTSCVWECACACEPVTRL